MTVAAVPHPPHASRFTHRLTLHASRLTLHASRFAPHVSCLTSHVSLPMPRMKLHQRAAEKVAVEVGIYFCGGNAFMSQHLLHGAQVRATFHQMSGERMS